LASVDQKTLEALREQFRIRSDHYGKTTVWAKDSRIDDAIISLLPRLCRDKIGVDVGAGTGRLTKRLTVMGERWVSLDLSPEMLCAGSAPNAVVGNANDLPLAEGCAVAVVAQSVLPFVAYDVLLTQVSHLLCPGGVAIVADKVLGELRGTDEEWYHSLEKARNPARRPGRRTEDLADEAETMGYECEVQSELPFEYQESLDEWYQRATRMPGSDVLRLQQLLERRPSSVFVEESCGEAIIRYTLTWAVLRLKKPESDANAT
jgi:SAM-dependent methyltransferase